MDVEMEIVIAAAGDHSGNIMTREEVKALFKCKDDLRYGIDPLVLATKLHELCRLPTSVFCDVTTKFQHGCDRVEICELLISHLPANINIPNLTEVLDKCGYRGIASKLFLAFLKLNSSKLLHVKKSTAGQRAVVHTFFRRLKRMVHDAQFENPRLALRNLANRFVEQMNEEIDPVRKQLLADKCVAIIGAEIDAIAITFDNGLCKHDVFAQMKSLVKESSNTLITDVVYFGRLANANSIAGNFQESDDMLVEARCKAYNTGPCLELVNMLYIEVYVRLWQYEKLPSKELRESLMMWGRIGLESLEEEDVDTKRLWRRMFILRMVFCLLGLGNRANTLDGCEVDNACIKEATDLLADIDRNWYGIETRRQMFYYVARARLNEYKNNFSDCLNYLTKAIKCAHQGKFEEMEFITNYQDTIRKLINTYFSGNITSAYDFGTSRNFVETGSMSDITEITTNDRLVFAHQQSLEQLHSLQMRLNTSEEALFQTRNYVVLRNDSSVSLEELHDNSQHRDECMKYESVERQVTDIPMPSRNFVMQHSDSMSSFCENRTVVESRLFDTTRNQQALHYIPDSNGSELNSPAVLVVSDIYHEDQTELKGRYEGNRSTSTGFQSLKWDFNMMTLKDQETLNTFQQGYTNDHNEIRPSQLQTGHREDYQIDNTLFVQNLKMFGDIPDLTNRQETEDESTQEKHLNDNMAENNIPYSLRETDNNQLRDSIFNEHGIPHSDSFYDERGMPSGCSHGDENMDVSGKASAELDQETVGLNISSINSDTMFGD